MNKTTNWNLVSICEVQGHDCLSIRVLVVIRDRSSLDKRRLACLNSVVKHVDVNLVPVGIKSLESKARCGP